MIVRNSSKCRRKINCGFRSSSSNIRIILLCLRRETAQSSIDKRRQGVIRSRTTRRIIMRRIMRRTTMRRIMMRMIRMILWRVWKRVRR